MKYIIAVKNKGGVEIFEFPTKESRNSFIEEINNFYEYSTSEAVE